MQAKNTALFYGWYIVILTWMSQFLVSGVNFAIFFKPILDEFQLSRAALSSVQMAAILAISVFFPLIGRLIDRFGPKAILLVGTVAQSLSSAVTGLAGSVWQLYAARFLFEIKPLHSSQVLINRWFARKRGLALAVSSTSFPVGMLLLSPFSQYLVLTWGWRETLFFWAAVTLVLILPLALIIRNNPEEKGVNPDGNIEAPVEAGSKSPIATAGFTTGKALKSGALWLLSGTQAICGIGCGFMMTHIVVFTTDVGYSPMVGATLLSVQGGVNLIGVLFTGHLSDRTRRNRVLAFTHFIRALSFFSVVAFILISGYPLWILYGAMALFGFGFFTTAPLAAGLVADLFGNQRMGTIMGIILLCHMVGTAIGSYAGGVIFEFTGNYFLFFIVQGGLELLAVLFSLAIRRSS